MTSDKEQEAIMEDITNEDFVITDITVNYEYITAHGGEKLLKKCIKVEGYLK